MPAFPEDAEGSRDEYLLGKASPKKILKLSPDWMSGYDSYDPDERSIGVLRTYATRLAPDLRVTVVFGSWCGDSLRDVPRFLKVQDRLGRDRLKADYIGVDRSKMDPARKVSGMDIQRVPTFIVYWRGIEVGRIIESTKVSVEADLAEILERAGRP